MDASRFKIVAETDDVIDGEDCWIAAMVRANRLERSELCDEEKLRVEGWSNCNKDECRKVPEYGMMFCEKHRS